MVVWFIPPENVPVGVCVHVQQIIAKLYSVHLKAFCLVILFLINYVHIELVC